jgi:hypothetical protein
MLDAHGGAQADELLIFAHERWKRQCF